MYKFLGADPEKARPLDEKTQPGFRSEKPGQFYRKGKIGDWQNYVTDDARDWFNEEAGQELIAQGYADDLNW